jgi:integrase
MLFFDIRFSGQRCREQTTLSDTPKNRADMARVLTKIDKEIAAGTFEYRRYFPHSKKAAEFEVAGGSAPAVAYPAQRAAPLPMHSAKAPTFEAFARQHYSEQGVGWRANTRDWMESLLETHLLPAFGNRPVNSLRREDILAFRLLLSEKKDSKGNPRLSPKSINTVLRVLKSILTEASLRYGFPHPMAGIKRLKVPRRDIVPFSMDEVQQMLSTVRPDYRNFLIVGFFTGMRPAEQIGLRWENIDFEKREIRVRETLSKGRVEYTKTDGSQREIAMSEPVFQALQDQHAATSQRSDYVFCLKGGQPVDAKNFSDRVWHPLIRYLGLKRRTPYQMRHTCATMWLAAGENPEWIARQLGHTTTEMLFRVYSRFIPNLTRKDGSAFDRLVSDAMKKTPSDAAHPKTASSKTEHSGQGDTK